MSRSIIYINGKELDYWGCCVESLDPIFLPSPIKPFPRNDNRLMHGVEVLRDAPRFNSKEFTLVFGFYRREDNTYNRVNKFIESIYKGNNFFYANGEKHMIDYISSTEFKSLKGVIKLAIKFEIANPMESMGDYGDDYGDDY